MITLDPSVRRLDGDRVLLGGSPLRLLRLSDSARSVLAAEDWDSRTGRALAARLLAAGLAHPRPVGGPGRSDVSVVIPVRDRAEGVGRLVAGLDPALEVIVVDDGSVPSLAPLPRATLVRHEVSLGPAAARNSGIALATRPFIALLDSDVVAPAAWLDALLPHFADSQVAAVAPRIVVARGDLGTDEAPTSAASILARYDAARSPLDLGGRPARVSPGSRVSYVPSAALVLRRSALGAEQQVFDQQLRFGEDVDLVWRLIEAGWTVRYEPASVVGHAHRTTFGAAAAQRFSYGYSAAPLAIRHPGKLAPYSGNRWTIAAWALLAAGHPADAAATLAVTTGRLARTLPVRRPAALATRLVAAGSLAGGRALGEALTRTYGPIALPVLLAPGPARALRARVALASLVIPSAIEYIRRRPDLDPLPWLALRCGDDLAYGAGVLAGCLRRRTTGPLRPMIS